MASTKTPTSTSNGTGRLPSTRERRPALAALAVLLIVGGALASAWLAMQSGHRADFVQVNADVAEGQEISANDLRTVELPEDFDGGIPASERDDLVGKFTTTRWTPGMVVVDEMFTDESDIAEDRIELALPVKAALAPELESGSKVAVYTGKDTAIDGFVASAPSTSEGDFGSSEDASALISIPSTCGTEVTTAEGEDAVSVALATGSKTVVRTECSGS